MDQVCLFYSVIRREHGDPLIEELNPGDALEPEGRGTGKATQLSTTHTLGQGEARSQAARVYLPPGDPPEEDGNGGEPWAYRQESGKETTPPSVPRPAEGEQDSGGGCCFSGRSLLCRDGKVGG